MDKNFLKQLKAGNRRVLAQAITLVESTLALDFEKADQLLNTLITPGASPGHAHCIGVTGAPGVGKSSFIETFGTFLTNQGKKVAVLAIDPSSPVLGGSILADKTRMNRLSRHPNAYIRPSTSGGFLGGVAPTTGDVITLLDAAGFDIIIVETIGIGQNETAVKDYVDQLIYLISPVSGDELQAMKKGISEVADMIVITKDDQDLKVAAERTALAYTSIDKSKPVFKCSALEERGIEEIWLKLQKKLKSQTNNRQVIQRLRRFHDRLQHEVMTTFLNHPDVANVYPTLTSQVKKGTLLTHEAIRKLIKLGFHGI
jgi:LAO/AO transport system kinase